MSDAPEPSRPPSEKSTDSRHFRRKDGTVSKMRSHAGNVPVLPQTQLCPHCPAKFTRSTHLSRHIRTHTNERTHRCDRCGFQFTRSDLLNRHKKTCADQANRRRACVACTESKIKCNRENPCDKCVARNKDCVYAAITSRKLMKHLNASTEDRPSASTSAERTASPPRSIAASPDQYYLYQVDGPIGDHTDLPVPTAYANPASSASASDTASTVTTQSFARSDFSSLSYAGSSYDSVMFEPLFSGIFADPASQSQPTVPASTSYGSTADLQFFSLLENATNVQAVPNPVIEEECDLSVVFKQAVDVRPVHTAQEDGVPAYLFYSAFLSQIPVVHPATFPSEPKCELLKNAMRACGAVFVKTRKAKHFIIEILSSSKEELNVKQAKTSPNSQMQQHLLIAGQLLQTVGHFHQEEERRVAARRFHVIWMNAVRQAGIMDKNVTNDWIPDESSSAALEASWHRWIRSENLAYQSSTIGISPRLLSRHLLCRSRLKPASGEHPSNRQ